METKFKVEKMFRLPDAGNLKAFCDVSVNDELIIKGVRIVEGKKGMFVSPPTEEGRDGKWYDQITFKTAEVYDAFFKCVIEHYKNNS
jgi:stage V sporulation protein G